MKKLLALTTFLLLMGLSVMVVHADIGQPITPETRWVNVDESLNVRWVPNMQSAIITTLDPFERVVVDRRFGSGHLAWYHVTLVSDVAFVRGWVFGGYLGQMGDHVPPPPLRTLDYPPAPAAPHVPVAPAPPAPPVVTAQDVLMRVNTSTVNVRSTPTSREGPDNIIGAVTADTWVIVNPTDRQRVHGTGELAWFYVRVVDTNFSGWIFSGLLSHS